MRTLVTGGAGYIGSVMVPMLIDGGHSVLVVDDLSSGHREAVGGADLRVIDLEDPASVGDALWQFKPDVCLHFAAHSLVGESMLDPLKYFRTNVGGGLNLLRAMAEVGCYLLVFSSTAATYGVPAGVPIVEDAPTKPVNPYGSSKLTFERMLAELSRINAIRYASLRYFNAAGADLENGLGEDHNPETHLIPRVIAAALGREPEATVYGNDYPTPDGTCIRDYIHVLDLCRAHMLALKHLEGGGESRIYNLGNGNGFSVREVIESVRRISGAEFEVVESGRRAGDPPSLVASSDRIREELGWEPAIKGLDEIVETAWEWHREHPDGYEQDH
jgi:UDP-glucose 4-epimerase